MPRRRIDFFEGLMILAFMKTNLPDLKAELEQLADGGLDQYPRLSMLKATVEEALED